MIFLIINIGYNVFNITNLQVGISKGNSNRLLCHGHVIFANPKVRAIKNWYFRLYYILYRKLIKLRPYRALSFLTRACIFSCGWVCENLDKNSQWFYS